MPIRMFQGFNNIASIDYKLDGTTTYCGAVSHVDPATSVHEDTLYALYSLQSTLPDAQLYVLDGARRGEFRRSALNDILPPTSSVAYSVLISKFTDKLAGYRCEWMKGLKD